MNRDTADDDDDDDDNNDDVLGARHDVYFLYTPTNSADASA